MSPTSRRSLLLAVCATGTGAFFAAALSSAAAQSGGDTSSPPSDPVAFLKWSMARHQTLKSYRATVEWSLRSAAKGQVPAESTNRATRQIDYVAPNRFRIVSTMDNGYAQTSVSDGKRQVEYSNQKANPAITADAPASLGEGRSMFLGHPMFCGSLLYLFLDGPDAYARLVKEGKDVPSLRFGPDVTVTGTPCRVVKFTAATGTYGNVQVVIGAQDGLVRQIAYDSAPLLKMMREQGGPAAAITLFETTERYVKVEADAAIAEAMFATTLPEGTTAQQASSATSAPSYKPPVPLGKPAPTFTVATLAGKPVSLESLRGKVVLIDFWATWCPPCRKGLPDTLRLHKELGGKGLAVLAVTDEDAKTVSPFLQKNGLASLPAYLDAGNAAAKAYSVRAIPTVAVIDRQGNLSAFFVGLQEPEALREALKKAGL